MRKQRTLSRSRELWAYAFLAVPIVFYVVVRFYPSIFAFYLSLTDWDIVSRDKGFVGFENYARLFSDSVFRKTKWPPCSRRAARLCARACAS